MRLRSLCSKRGCYHQSTFITFVFTLDNDHNTEDATMVIIPDHLLEIYGNRDKNDPSVTASCIQELQAKVQKEELHLARVRDNMECNFRVLFNPDHEDYISCVQHFFDKFVRELGKGGQQAQDTQNLARKRPMGPGPSDAQTATKEKMAAETEGQCGGPKTGSRCTDFGR